jgi:NAD-dependent DNA ligase
VRRMTTGSSKLFRRLSDDSAQKNSSITSSKLKRQNHQTMASTNLISMMRSKGAPFTDELLERMSDSECWRWVYTHNKPKKSKSKNYIPQHTICFTGFTLSRKKELTDLALASGWCVISSPNNSMSHLCTGETPGPSKIERANEICAMIIPESDFLDMLGHSPAPKNDDGLLL